MAGDHGAAGSRFRVLDGWRGISILAVLACHLLPLGPKSLRLNDSAGLFGMALFFTLSGFLITRFLLRGASVPDFLIRRLCRILPLAWIALLVGLWMQGAPDSAYLPNFLFFANYPPFWLLPATSHFWSLCVEMQFYVAAAFAYGVFGRRGLTVGILAGLLGITCLRVYTGTYWSIVTYLRADEILAGAALALLYEGTFGNRTRAIVGGIPVLPMLALYGLSTLHFGGALQYARPYLASLLVGATLLSDTSALHDLLASRPLAYIAEISYALYIVHPLLADTWLGTGAKLVKYAKRPLLFGAAFAVAHASTFWYERRWIAWGKKLGSRWTPSERLAPAV